MESGARFRFSLFSILVLTGIAAAVIAFDLYETAGVLLLQFVIPLVILSVILRLLVRFRQHLAEWMAPHLGYSWGAIWGLAFVCGRQNTARALSVHGVKLHGDKHFDQAIRMFSLALRLDAGTPEYWSNRGAAKYSAGQFSESIDDLTTALSYREDSPYTLAYRGLANMRLNNFPAAIEDLVQVKCFESDHYYVACCRGHVREKLHQWQLAANDYSLAYELNPTQVESGLALALLQSGCPDARVRDGEKAKENATNLCVRTDWKSWGAVGVLAAAYSELRDFENALKYAHLALELAPDEEKETRRERISQFEKRLPFRLPYNAPTTGLPEAESK